MLTAVSQHKLKSIETMKMCTQLQYIYHKATASILTEIQANGVQPSDSSSRDHHEKNLAKVRR